MAGENQQPQVASFDDTRAYLYQTIHAPLFFEKLASDYGVYPRTPEHQEQLLTMGAYLFSEEQKEHEKAAAANGNFISAAYDGLFGALSESGVANPQQVQLQQSIKQAAVNMVHTNPDLLKMALTFGAYMAQSQG